MVGAFAAPAQDSTFFYPLDLSDAHYALIDPFFRREVEESSQILAALVKEGLLQRHHIQGEVVDFGCGLGGSTFVLGQNRARVTAVDNSEAAMRGAQQFCYAIAKELRCEDGIEYLQKLPAGSLDLVSAFMFGPDNSRGQFARNFYQAASYALKADGRIVATSDYETIAYLFEHIPSGQAVFRDYKRSACCVATKAKLASTDFSLSNSSLPACTRELREMFRFMLGAS